jgi:type IV secretion system protein VirB2
MSFNVGRRLALAASLSALAAQEALAQQTQGPAGSGPIVGAVRWVQESALGPIATAVAVIAVAAVGFMMLTGRMNWKHGITVIIGCFVLFGATAIVAGIQTAASTAR